jgi:hypothetical protein
VEKIAWSIWDFDTRVKLREFVVLASGGTRWNDTIDRTTTIALLYLREELVHLTSHAFVLELAAFGAVLVTQKVATQQRVVDEALENHVHEASGAHVAKTAKTYIQGMGDGKRYPSVPCLCRRRIGVSGVHGWDIP